MFQAPASVAATAAPVEARLESIAAPQFLPGDTWTLPKGAGSVEFTGFERWASFQIAQDPGKELALLAAMAAIAGLMLSLFVRRRRLWVKVAPVDGGGTLVQVAALGKTETADLTDDVTILAEHLGGPAAEKGNAS